MTYQVLNPAFATGASASFGRFFFNTVRNDAPQDLKDIFKAGGYLCTARGRVPHPVRQHAARRRHHQRRTAASPADRQLISRGGGPSGPATASILSEGHRQDVVTSAHHDPARRAARWALSPLLLGTLMVLLAARRAAPAAGVLRPCRAVDPGAVTVPAPGAGAGATVTVSRTPDLVNQTVAVSWAGFRPSSATRLDEQPATPSTSTPRTRCASTSAAAADPASSSDCYGSPGFRGIEATPDAPALPAVPPFTYPGQTDPFDATPDGPANWQDNVTRRRRHR